MIETVFYWLALCSYTASSIVYLVSLTFSRPGMRSAGMMTALSGILLHTVSLGVRWAETGHGPYISTYEILSSNVWIAVLFFLLFQWRYRIFVNLGALVMPLSFLMMGFALLGSTEAKSLTPTLRSVWLFIHIVFAKLTVAALIVSLAMAVFYLLKVRDGDRAIGFLSRLPSPAVLDDFSSRLVAFGFIALTIMIITGAIWANNSWGSYWAWDPTETWSLVVWFVYGIYLHGRVTFRWKGRTSAWYLIAAFILSIVSFYVIPYFVKSLHSQYMIG